MDIQIIINTMLVLFGIILIGYIINKLKILDKESNKILSRLIVMVVSPALILGSVSGENSQGDKTQVIFLALTGIVLYLCLPIFAKLVTILFGFEKKDKPTYELLLIFSNASFMGYPIAQSMFGEKAVFYMSVLNLPFNILLFTYGIHLVTAGKAHSSKFRLKDALHPGIVSSVLALIIFLFDIRVPQVPGQIFVLAGSAAIPLSMLVIGSSLALIPIKEIFAEIKIYLFVLLKLIIMPLIVYFIMRIFTTDALIIGLSVLTVSLPTGSMTVMLTTEYNGNIKIASVFVFLTTLLSIVTIPLIAYLLKLV